MAEKSKTQTKDKELSPIQQQFVDLHTQGKSVREIHEETGFSVTGIRKFINEYTGRTPRAYKRTVYSYSTGKPFVSAESNKIKSLKTDNHSLKKELSAEQKKADKLTKENHTVKRDNRDLKYKADDAQQKALLAEESIAKLKDQKSDLNTTIHNMKVKGYWTDEHKAMIINDYLLEVDKAGYKLADPSRIGTLIPLTEVFYRPKSSKSSKK